MTKFIKVDYNGTTLINTDLVSFMEAYINKSSGEKSTRISFIQGRKPELANNTQTTWIETTTTIEEIEHQLKRWF